MNTQEIISAFMKGNSKVTISEKQKNWLIGTAKKEGIPVGFDGWDDTLYFDDCFYKIKQCKRLASGGSYVGTKSILGKYNLEKMYTVRFTDTGYVFVHDQNEIDRLKREGYKFDIITPKINTSTR